MGAGVNTALFLFPKTCYTKITVNFILHNPAGNPGEKIKQLYDKDYFCK